MFPEALAVGLAVALAPVPLVLLWVVHCALIRVCVGHARRYCARRGLQPSRARWRPAFDESGIKTGSTLVQLDCLDQQRGRRLVTLRVWPFGVREQLGDEAFPEAGDEWPPEPAGPSDAADARPASQ